MRRLSPRKRRFWPHQREAFSYAMERRHPAIFMEMRLGKTLVAIRRALACKPRNPRTGSRFLVVAPTAAVGSWVDELELENELDYQLLTNMAADDRCKALQNPCKWNIINPEAHRADGVAQALTSVVWDFVVVDESTVLKNPKAQVSKFFCRHFRDVPHRMILTGLPSPEEQLELFQQFKFLDGGQTFERKNYWAFRNETHTQYGYDWIPNPGVRQWIDRKVSERAFVCRRDDVNMDVDRVYERRTLELPQRLEKLRNEALRTFMLKIDGKEIKRTKWTVETYSWLRQMCGGFVDEELVWEGKINEVKNLLNGDLADEKVVIWHTYNQELHELYKELSNSGCSVERIWGDVDVDERRRIVRRFQTQQDPQVLLLQVKAAYFGVNLNQADTAIYYSTPLSNELRTQSEDRILKAGQQSPLLIIDLIVENSVDEDAWQMQQDKTEQSLSFMNAVRAIIERNRNQ